MNKEKFEDLVKKALMLETQSRTAFLADIKDDEIKNKLEFILEDDTQSTDFIINTSAGSPALDTNQFSDFKAGDEIKQFTIVKLIAKGGMGCVYLAYDKKLKRNVALKTIRSEYLKSKSSQQRFEREAQILSQINHTSICQIYDYLSYKDGDLLVLELVNGQTLNKIDLNDKEKLDVFIQIASALVVAHEKGVIHRDLKPDNIMLTDDGIIKVLDFGIAKSQIGSRDNLQEQETKHVKDDNNLTNVGSLMGTLIYMSPEQASVQEVTKASDIYSLAIIMQEILTGQSAYNLVDTEDLKQQVINARVVNTESLPKNYEVLIGLMTVKDPLKRPNASELLKSLRKIQQVPIRKKTKRRKVYIGSTFLLLSIIFIWQMIQSNNHKQKNLFTVGIYEKINQAKEVLDKAYTLPKHDISNELKQSELIIEKLNIGSNQYLNQSEKARLKGEALLAIDKFSLAIPFLEKAWVADNQNSELAQNIATAMVMKYWQDSFINDENKEESESYRKQNMQESQNLLSKASSYFSQAKKLKNEIQIDLSNIEAYNYYAIAEYHKALDALNMDTARTQGDYIKFNLLGNIYWQLYKLNYIDEKIPQAYEYLQQSITAYESAISFGRSYVDSYLNLCTAKIEYLENTIYDNIKEDDDLYKQTYNSCENAVAIMPTKSFSLNKMSELILRYLDFLNQIGLDITKYAEDAKLWNQKAIELNPDPFSYKMQGFVYDVMASEKLKSGLNPIDDGEQAIKAYQQAIKIKPRYLARHTANIFYTLVYKFRYKLQHGQSLLHDIKQTEGIFESAIRNNKSIVKEGIYFYINMALLQNLTAQSEVQFGGNVQYWLEKSIANYQQVLDEPVDVSYAKTGIIENKILQVNILLDEGNVPYKLIGEIIQLIDEVKILEKSEYWFNVIEYDLAFIQLNMALIAKKPIKQHLDNMYLNLQQSIKLNANEVEVYIKLSEYYLIKLYLQESDVEQAKIVNFGLVSLNKAISINPQIAQVYWLKAQLIEYAVNNKIELMTQDLSVQELKAKAKSINPKFKLNYFLFLDLGNA